MDFRHEITYDAPPDEVFAMLATREFRERVCDAQRVLARTVTIEDGDTPTKVTIDQTQAAEGIPSFARKLIGDEVHIVQQETWTGQDRADLLVEIPGKPGSLQGTVALAAEGKGTVETVSGRITVNIPVVARKVEGLIGNLLASALKAESRVGERWLTERSG